MASVPCLPRRTLGEGRIFGALAPEPERVVIWIFTRKGKLSPAAEKFHECASEAFSVLR